MYLHISLFEPVAKTKLKLKPFLKFKKSEPRSSINMLRGLGGVVVRVLAFKLLGRGFESSCWKVGS